MTTCERLRPLLSRRAEGDLAPDEALRVGRHVQDCTACRIRLARERRLAEMVTSLGDPIEVDEAFLGRVMDGLSRVAPPRRTRGRRGLKLAGVGLLLGSLGSAAAACLSKAGVGPIAEAVPGLSGGDGGARIASAVEGLARTAAAAATLDGATFRWDVPDLSALLASLAVPALVVTVGVASVVVWTASKIARSL